MLRLVFRVLVFYGFMTLGFGFYGEVLTHLTVWKTVPMK